MAHFEKMTKEEAKAFIRRVMGHERRTLFDQEHDYMLTIFRLIDPIESSNNQLSWTDVYEHAGKTYHVHTFNDGIEIEEIITNDIQQD